MYSKTPDSGGRAPVLVLPGLGNSSGDYSKLAQILLQKGHEAVAVAPIARWQWGLNAQGFIKRSYWTSTLKPNEVLKWYMRQVQIALTEIRSECGPGRSVCVIGHSAGGWLGRVFIAEEEKLDVEFSTLLTLGTPNIPPAEGMLDQTRGLLRYVERECDISQKVANVVSVVGNGIVGKPFGKGSVSETVAFFSYQAVCGRGDVDGDGVTPVEAAFIRGSKELVVPNCGHSMLTGTNWYGSIQAVNEWCKFLV